MSTLRDLQASIDDGATAIRYEERTTDGEIYDFSTVVSKSKGVYKWWDDDTGPLREYPFADFDELLTAIGGDTGDWRVGPPPYYGERHPNTESVYPQDYPKACLVRKSTELLTSSLECDQYSLCHMFCHLSLLQLKRSKSGSKSIYSIYQKGRSKSGSKSFFS